MPSRGVDHRPFKLAVSILLPAALTAAGLAYMALAADFPGHVDLSRTPYLSGPPDIKAFGDRVFVAWSDGFNDDNGRTKNWGTIYLKGAVEGDKWYGKTGVMNSDINNWGIDPRFVFDQNGGKVHVVWAGASGCNGSLQYCSGSFIRYAVCSVAGTMAIGCQSALLADTSFPAYRTPDIVQDSNVTGTLYAVWSDLTSHLLRYSWCDDTYSTGTGGTCANSANWSLPVEVGNPATHPSANGANPQLAFSNGMLHLAWEDDTVGNLRICYSDDSSPGQAGHIPFAAGCAVYWKPSTAWPSYPAHNYANPGSPTIAATGTLVYVGWDMKDAADPLGTTYALAYALCEYTPGRSCSSPKGVPSNQDYVFSNAATDSGSGTSTEFNRGLKPSLVLTSTGSTNWLHLAWHEKVIGTQQIFYSYLTAVDAPAWSPSVQVTDFGGSTAPDLAVSQAGNVHVAYMEKPVPSADWDVFYSGPITGTQTGGVFLPLMKK